MSFLCRLLIFEASLLSIFFNDPATTEIYTLSLHDALPISEDFDLDVLIAVGHFAVWQLGTGTLLEPVGRSEEHTSELQSRRDLVCRLLLEKKKMTIKARIEL